MLVVCRLAAVWLILLAPACAGDSPAEATIELCDGRPSDVERQGTNFGGGRFCPWNATIVRIDES
jgi:hypothetical protein